MRAAILLATAVVLLLPSAAASGRQKPFVLTALADIGTVYWRYDFSHRAPQWSLGVHVFATAATTGATYRAGGFKRQRTLQPGYPTTWFPFRRERRQSLAFVQGTEAGTLRAVVTVRFNHHNYESYFPPRFSVELYPR